MKVLKGTWVEIKSVILESNQRVAKLPEDTKKVPLISFIQGYLEEDAYLNEEVSIISIINRRHFGTLVNINPTFTHNYGQPIKELLPIGQELKLILYHEKGGEPD